jgi:hypothetical protein
MHHCSGVDTSASYGKKIDFSFSVGVKRTCEMGTSAVSGRARREIAFRFRSGELQEVPNSQEQLQLSGALHTAAAFGWGFRARPACGPPLDSLSVDLEERRGPVKRENDLRYDCVPTERSVQIIGELKLFGAWGAED